MYMQRVQQPFIAKDPKVREMLIWNIVARINFSEINDCRYCVIDSGCRPYNVIFILQTSLCSPKAASTRTTGCVYCLCWSRAPTFRSCPIFWGHEQKLWARQKFFDVLGRIIFCPTLTLEILPSFRRLRDKTQSDDNVCIIPHCLLKPTKIFGSGVRIALCKMQARRLNSYSRESLSKQQLKYSRRKIITHS